MKSGTLETALGHRFSRRRLLELALTHRSYVAEHPEVEHNERLEFLGDAVLQLAVTERLLAAYPELAEGELAKVRAAVVNARSLAEVARSLALGDHLRLGRGEELTGGRDKSSILSDGYEAVLGALFLDAGYEQARAVILHQLGPAIVARAEAPGSRDYKTRLQELTVRTGSLPVYHTTAEGPDHARVFASTVTVGGAVAGQGTGKSKKAAEQEAARRALDRLDDASTPART